MEKNRSRTAGACSVAYGPFQHAFRTGSEPEVDNFAMFQQALEKFGTDSERVKTILGRWQKLQVLDMRTTTFHIALICLFHLALPRWH